MFVNKINSGSNQVFKGFNQGKNNAGETVLKFNHPASRSGECYVEFYNVREDENTLTKLY